MGKDIRNTPFGQMVHDFFEHLAQGNEGSVTVNTLDLSGTILSFDIDVRHHQVAEIKIPFDGTQDITLYDVTTNVNGAVDLKNPQPDNVNLKIDTPVGPIAFSLAELIQALLAAGILA